ncbi:sugar transporter family protein [Aulographum hederae CBS 113979]|uniref:Sugar transporter family protein n=1 Tax=Aulographum hederae CBS 113979 TaxID=1176131 RepID=A0A6G1H8H6_9PEZI|nr:sugar transporter family protein [Aulographum hederae CBS 113979]
MYREKVKDTPKKVLNPKLWTGVFVFGLMGAARGLDEGLIGTTYTLPSFIARFGLEDPSLSTAERADLLSNIASMVQLGSILGALIAFWLTEKIGRLWATRQLCLVWAAGISIFLAAAPTGNIAMVYAGRFIAGVGIEQTTVVAPTYLAEIALPAIRGFRVCMFSGSVYLGIMVAYFASWSSSIHLTNSKQAQWPIPNSLHIVFSSMIFLLSFLARTLATSALERLRKLPSSHPFVQQELKAIVSQLPHTQAPLSQTPTLLTSLRALLFHAPNRNKLLITLSMQLLSQWSGASSITMYAPYYFSLIGKTSNKDQLLVTTLLGVVKFVSAVLCAIFLIDFIGRRKALGIGISLQLISLLYIAIFLGVTGNATGPDPESASGGTHPTTTTTAIKPNTHATHVAILSVYVSALAWALGWNSIQYLLPAETFSLPLRALGSSFTTTAHFATQYGNSKAVPRMLLAMGGGGTMGMFAGITGIGGLWAWWWLPEGAGRALEDGDNDDHVDGEAGMELEETENVNCRRRQAERGDGDERYRR